MLSGLGVALVRVQENKKRLGLFAITQLSADEHLYFKTTLISAKLVDTDA